MILDLLDKWFVAVERVGSSIALGYVPAALATADSGFEIELIGERYGATRLAGAAYDPTGGLMRK